MPHQSTYKWVHANETELQSCQWTWSYILFALTHDIMYNNISLFLFIHFRRSTNHIRAVEIGKWQASPFRNNNYMENVNNMTCLIQHFVLMAHTSVSWQYWECVRPQCHALLLSFTQRQNNIHFIHLKNALYLGSHGLYPEENFCEEWP